MSGARLIAGTMVLALAACSPVLSRKPASAADLDPLRREVVVDVVAGLSDIYEPTATVLVPARPMSGAFDTALLAALRAKGFTVREGGSGERFDSHIDPLEGRMYRVVTTVDKTVLSRLWVLNGATAYPGGDWTRRE